LVDGFDTPPRVMMNHNPPYYARLLESWGLEKAKDLWAWWFTADEKLLIKWSARYRRFTERAGFRVRPFSKRESKLDIQRSKAVYDGAWQHNWGYVPMTDAEFFHF